MHNVSIIPSFFQYKLEGRWVVKMHGEDTPYFSCESEYLCLEVFSKPKSFGGYFSRERDNIFYVVLIGAKGDKVIASGICSKL